MRGKEDYRSDCAIYMLPLPCYESGVYVLIRTLNIAKLSDINNSYFFGYQKNSYIFIPISKEGG